MLALVAALFTTQGRATTPPASEAALEQLREIERRYSALDIYSDRGEIEVTEVRGGIAAAPQRFRFETSKEEGRFALRLAGEGRTLIVVRDGEGARQYDSWRGLWRPVPTPSSGLPRLLAWGEGTNDLLLVPLLLAEPGATRTVAQTAVLEDAEPCPPPVSDHVCSVLRTRQLGGGLESRIVVDQESGLVRALEVRAESASDVMARALHEAGLAAGGDGEKNGTFLTARYSDISTHEARPLLDLPTGGGSDVKGGPRHTVRDEIAVIETATTVRVVDAHGEPILGLGRDDFRVRAGKRPVPVRAVDWISSSTPLGHDVPPELRVRYDIYVDPPGKLVVFFVQADLHASRAVGQLKNLKQSRKLIAGLERDDWVAVVSFDSHLKLRQEFTRDRDLAADSLAQAIRLGRAPPLGAGRYPSLGRYLDAAEARRTASPERALELVGSALARLPGEKVVIFVGWGLGRYGSGGVTMTPDYAGARTALARANATVFVLDITQADYHSLELGLQQVARDTGGTYAKTFHHPNLATQRIAATIAGYYRLTLAMPTDVAKRRRLVVELQGRKGTVLAAPEEVRPQR